MAEGRPLREYDTLGRAGRVLENGKRAERNREMTAVDERRTIVAAEFDDPRVAVAVPVPVTTDKFGRPLTVVQADDHQTLMSLDGSGEVRPSKSWEEMNAAKRREVGEREREAFARSLKRERAALKLPERIARLQHRALVMQSQKAAQRRETDARGAVEGDRAPQGDGHDAIGYADAAEVAVVWRQIELLVERVEGWWDAHDGVEVRDVTLMSKTEKDALILSQKTRGLHPDVIHAIYGDAIGKPATIRKTRSDNGQDHLGFERAGRAERLQAQAGRLAGLRARVPGLTQARLAAELGVHVNSVAAWERGTAEASRESCTALAGYFGVPVDEVVGSIPA